jgi:branched-chain amino acid transport system permease protein
MRNAKLSKPFLLLLLIFLLVYPFIFTNPFPRHLMIMIFLFGLTGTAWNIIGGYAGQVSLGHSMFFGMGAYTSTLLNEWYNLTPWLGIWTGAIVAVILAVIVGWPCFKLGGHYFAIATICISEVIHIVFLNWEKVGGAVGIYMQIREESLYNLQSISKIPYYYVIFAFLVAAILVTYILERSKVGYYLRAIKAEPDAARSLGVSITRYKMIAMVISAFFTAMAGTFYAQYVLYISPNNALLLMTSFQIALIAILGGTGTLFGPILGAFVLIPISEFSRVYMGGGGRGIDLIVYGALIMVIAAIQPSGLMGIIKGKYNNNELALDKGE